MPPFAADYLGPNTSMAIRPALTAQGQAMETGAIGERIRVLNPVSRAVVEAEVIGPDRVRVAPNAFPMRISVR